MPSMGSMTTPSRGAVFIGRLLEGERREVYFGFNGLSETLVLQVQKRQGTSSGNAGMEGDRKAPFGNVAAFRYVNPVKKSAAAAPQVPSGRRVSEELEVLRWGVERKCRC